VNVDNIGQLNNKCEYTTDQVLVDPACMVPKRLKKGLDIYIPPPPNQQQFTVEVVY